MISFVNTLNKLAHAANSEAVKLQAKKDKASIDKAKALFAKQGQFVSLVKELQDLQSAIADAPDPVDQHFNAIFHTIVDKMNGMVKSIKDLPISDKKIIDAITDPQTYHLVAQATHVITLLKKNLELRHKVLNEELANKDFDVDNDVDVKKRQKFRAEYEKRCEEDHKNILAALAQPNPFALGVSIEEANRRWNELLKRVFNIDTPEPKKQVAPKNAFSDFFSKGLDAVSKFAKDMVNAKDKKAKQGVFMGFLGMLLPLVFGLVANLFKPLFGKTTEERETKAAEFTENLSQFAGEMLKPEPKKSTKHKPTPAKKSKPEGEAVLPMLSHAKAKSKAKAKSATLHPSASSSTDLTPEEIAKLLSTQSPSSSIF